MHHPINQLLQSKVVSIKSAKALTGNGDDVAISFDCKHQLILNDMFLIPYTDKPTLRRMKDWHKPVSYWADNYVGRTLCSISDHIKTYNFQLTFDNGLSLMANKHFVNLYRNNIAIDLNHNKQ